MCGHIAWSGKHTIVVKLGTPFYAHFYIFSQALLKALTINMLSPVLLKIKSEQKKNSSIQENLLKHNLVFLVINNQLKQDKFCILKAKLKAIKIYQIVCYLTIAGMN